MKYDVHAIGGLTKPQLKKLAVSLKIVGNLSAFPVDPDFEPLPNAQSTNREMTLEEVKANFEGEYFPCNTLGIRSGPASGVTAVEFLTNISPMDLPRFLQRYGLQLDEVSSAASNTGSVIMYFKTGDQIIPSSMGKAGRVACVIGTGEVIPIPPIRAPFTMDHPVLELGWVNGFDPLRDNFTEMPAQMVLDLCTASVKGRVS